ncbi:hypothetical protein ACFVH6_09965 [Spirillospora sp. NPDC127200]
MHDQGAWDQRTIGARLRVLRARAAAPALRSDCQWTDPEPTASTD